MKKHLIRQMAYGLSAMFLLACGIGGNAHAQYPSDSAKVYLLTVSPGDEIYSYFGHSAIQIYDRIHHFNVAYGYGTFDTETPYFYEKFIFGRLWYSLSVDPYEDFMLSYVSSGQAVYHQLLNLTNAEKWRLVQNLEANYKPENRYYRYDFLYDNCATRIRDIIEKSVSGQIRYGSMPAKTPVSFRDMLWESLAAEPWVALGINTMLGAGSDKKADLRDKMFLPDQLMLIITGSTVKSASGIRLLTGKPQEILPATFHPRKPSSWVSPEPVFSLLFVLVFLLTVWGYRKKAYSRWFDIFLFFITGFLGLLFLALWIGSLHRVMACNYNILWANPFNIVFVFFLIFPKKSPGGMNWMRAFLFVVFLAYLPVSVLVSHHFYLVPVLLDLLLLLRLWRLSNR